MPNTSVHFPGSVLEELDELAESIGSSRNRLIVEACRRTLDQRKQWPPDFFDPNRLSPEDLKLLREGAESFREGIVAARRSRKEPPF